MHLTNRPEGTHKAEADSLAEPTGAPEPEIEVTPEMIEAGLAELFSFDREADIPEEKVREIYLAMRRISLNGPKSFRINSKQS